jgi:hypothetical protein
MTIYTKLLNKDNVYKKSEQVKVSMIFTGQKNLRRIGFECQ